MKKLELNQLIKKADDIRKDVMEVAISRGAGHIAPSLSTVDILTVLYYNIMNISDDPKWEDRDRLVLSKAHGCYALYSILTDIGYLDRFEWENFYNESSLLGCVERNIDIGIEASCGSLGHGLPQAVGMAFAAKIQKKDYKVYCIVGDGEMQEGSNWEAIQFAVHHKLTNLMLIIDDNKLQAMDFTSNILSTSLADKTRAFGFCTLRCHGHSIEDLSATINILSQHSIENKPMCLIPQTIKGYGLKCMENEPKFHFRIPACGKL